MDESTPPPPHNPPPWSSPPPPPPPPLIIAPRTPPPRRGRGWMVFSIVLLLLLAMSMLMNLGNLFSRSLASGKTRSGRTVGPKLEEMVTEDNSAVNKIAVLEIGGIITSRTID